MPHNETKFEKKEHVYFMDDNNIRHGLVSEIEKNYYYISSAHDMDNFKVLKSLTFKSVPDLIEFLTERIKGTSYLRKHEYVGMIIEL